MMGIMIMTIDLSPFAFMNVTHIHCPLPEDIKLVVVINIFPATQQVVFINCPKINQNHTYDTKKLQQILLAKHKQEMH